MGIFYMEKRSKRAVLFLRTDPNERSILTEALQEQMLRKHCEYQNIEIMGVERFVGDTTASLTFLRELMDRMPERADSLLAARLTRYTDRYEELFDICYEYQLRRMRILSMDLPVPVAFELSQRLQKHHNLFICDDDPKYLPRR